MAQNKLRLFLTLHAISGLGTSTTTSTTSSSTTTTSSTTTSLPFLPNDCSYCPNCTLVNREHIFGGNSGNRLQVSWQFFLLYLVSNVTFINSGRSWLALELKMSQTGVISVAVRLSQTVPSFLLPIVFIAVNQVATKWAQKFVWEMPIWMMQQMMGKWLGHIR